MQQEDVKRRIPRSERTPSLCANIYDRRISQSAPYRQCWVALHRIQLQHTYVYVQLEGGRPPETSRVTRNCPAQGQPPHATANDLLTDALFPQNRKQCISDKTALYQHIRTSVYSPLICRESNCYIQDSQNLAPTSSKLVGERYVT